MAKKKPKFQKGDKVHHPDDYDDRFSAGTGTVVSVVPGTNGVAWHYEVRCDTTGEVLPVAFPEDELKKV